MKKILFILVIFTSLVSISLFGFNSAILIDTSKSIPKGEFEKAKSSAIDLSEQLLKFGGVTIVSFNDEPVFEGKDLKDISEIRQRISSIEQGGKFTLLYDAVFKTLENFEDSKEKGIIVIFTDGKDENSAVVLEDCSLKSQTMSIPVISVGMGIEDKSLKRLPSLTRGIYAGRVDSFIASDILSIAQREFEKKEKEEKKVESAPAPIVPPPLPVKEEKVSKSLYILPIVLFILFGIAVIVILYFLLSKNRKEKEKVCEVCGRPLAVWETECPNCFLKKLSDTQPGVAPPKVEEKIDLDPELFKKLPTSSVDIDSTMVLDEIPVLLHLRGNQPPRMYQIAKDQPTSVGRDKVNNIVIEDKTVSGQHFRIVPKEEKFFIVDLNSTNGTYVDGERVNYKEIKHGSQINAGQCQFVFRIEQKRIN
jgi:hypothetical protein